jgi:hypothetical protein
MRRYVCSWMYARGYGHEGCMWPWVRLWYTGAVVPGPGYWSWPSLERIGCAFGVEALRWQMSLSMAKGV